MPGTGGKKRISVCPPLCHPHLGDHITNRAFLKRSFSKGAQWGLSTINKQCESRGIYLKNQREWLAWPSSRPVCWNQIREWGLAGKVVRPQGCSTWRISLLLAPTADWFQTFLHVSGPSLILYMWKNSWRDRWVKGSIIYNPCSVHGEKIRSYFSNPTVVLHGWWLLPHASLTWFKENKITSVLVWQCVRAGGSVRLRLALCAVRREERRGGGGVRDGGTIPLRSQLKEIICTILWKLYLSGRMVLSKPNSHGGTWFKWRVSYKAGKMSG